MIRRANRIIVTVRNRLATAPLGSRSWRRARLGHDHADDCRDRRPDLGYCEQATHRPAQQRVRQGQQAGGTVAKDAGSAVVDFVLVSLILVPLFAGILQLGLALYVRNTLAACAQEGARYAAAEDIVRSGNAAITNAASQRTKSCVTDSLPNSFANGIAASTPTLTGAGGSVPVVEVQIVSPFPLIGLLGVGSGVLHATGDAMQERP